MSSAYITSQAVMLTTVIGDDGKQFVKGLLNRNPQNRLGAKRGAAELKEHPFFASIDWDLLYKKQITPPFKPIVDSDESVANFDPEFTNSTLADAGIRPWEDEDWGGSADPQARHSYLGPGGSLSSAGHMHNAAPSGVAINKQSRPGITGSGSPLTSSVQENFRGFTYTGESSLLVSHPTPSLISNCVETDSNPRPILAISQWMTTTRMQS